MAIFDAAISAAIAGRAIGAVPLVFFDFADAPMRLSAGFGTLNAGGYDWTGAGDLASVDGLNSTVSDAAQQVTFNLSGVTAEMQALALAAQDRVKGRAVTVYIQFFDLTTSPPMAAVGGMLAFWSGLMDVMTFTASGPSSRTISLTAENENADRRRPRFGLLTNADQQARYPGDTCLQYRPALRFKSLVTPW